MVLTMVLDFDEFEDDAGILMMLKMMLLFFLTILKMMQEF